MLEATPLVIDGVMYTSQPGATVALDAVTGRQLWRSVRQQKVKNPNEINPFSRGVAVLDQRLFVGTLDAALLALDVSTGKPLWEIQVADSMVGYTITSPPLVVKDKVIVGVSGGEFGARGFLDAYEPATGQAPVALVCACPVPANSVTTPGPATAGNRVVVRCGSRVRTTPR